MTKLSLKGITWDHPRGYDPLIAASTAYQKDFGVEISWRKRSLQEFGEQSLADLASQFDLLIIDHPHMGVAAESACLVPLDGLISEEGLEILSSESAGPSFSSYHYLGHQWALPVDAAMQAASYRPDLFDQETPKTWDAVFELAHDLRRVDKYVGKALCPTDAMCTFLSLAAQLEGPVKEEGNELVDPVIGMEVLHILRRMQQELHPGGVNWNPIQLYDHMSQEHDVVFSPMDFVYSNYSRDGFRPNLLAFSNAVGQVSILGGAGIAVSSNCAFPDLAAAFCNWICRSDCQSTIYATVQGQPGNIQAWKDPQVNSLTHNFFTNTLGSMESAYMRPRYPAWPELQEAMGFEIHDFLVNQGEAAKTLHRLNEAYQRSQDSRPQG